MTRFTTVTVLMLLWVLSFKAYPVQAGSGPTLVIPASNSSPTMDGVCDPIEYSGAAQVSITVGTNQPFPIYMKRTASDAYFCFGDASGLPLPNGGEPQVAVYIDRDDGGSNDGGDFGVWMPYAPGGAPWSNSYSDGAYTGPDPGGWEAVKHQTPGIWQVEFRISRQTLGGWNHKVGLALFYHWWRWQGDDFSWPANGIWGSPQWWGNAQFTTGTVHIVSSPTVPPMDGLCDSEYSDASTINFTAPNGVVTAYLEHSLTDLYVCLKNLTTPSPSLQDEPNAALYIDRTGTGGGAPGADDLRFTISYNGTVRANSGDGNGYTGPDPGGHVIVMSHYSGVWDAEFQISGVTIGRWRPRRIGLTVAEQGVSTLGDYYGWPIGSAANIPNSWGVASLIGLGSQQYLPVLAR